MARVYGLPANMVGGHSFRIGLTRGYISTLACRVNTVYIYIYRHSRVDPNPLTYAPVLQQEERDRVAETLARGLTYPTCLSRKHRLPLPETFRLQRKHPASNVHSF